MKFTTTPSPPKMEKSPSPETKEILERIRQAKKQMIEKMAKEKIDTTPVVISGEILDGQCFSVY